MSTRAMWLSVLAVIISFAGGFLVANSLNSGELKNLRAENDRLKSASPATTTGTPNPNLTLTPEEIRSKIAEADTNKDKFNYQKNFGIALYRYAASQQDTALLAEATRILTRANTIDGKDRDVLISLAHSHFDQAYFGKQNADFEKAREIYMKALALDPKDVETQTEIGMTYFLSDPPDLAKSIAEYQKSLKINPKHEKTLQYLVQAYARSGNKVEAEKNLAELRGINPGSPVLTELVTLIEKGSEAK